MTVKKAKLRDFIFDPHNANKGTERGRKALDNSIAEVGLGRSIVVDKNGVVIAGNKTLERALQRGLGDAIVIETQGDQLVVVQRTDLDLARDPKARKLAYYDNRVGELNLAWDAQKIASDIEAGLDLSSVFSDVDLKKIMDLDTPPAEFAEYDENIPFEYRCPKCGYCWSGGKV